MGECGLIKCLAKEGDQAYIPDVQEGENQKENIVGEAVRWGRHWCRLPLPSRRPPCIYTAQYATAAAPVMATSGPLLQMKMAPAT